MKKYLIKARKERYDRKIRRRNGQSEKTERHLIVKFDWFHLNKIKEGLTSIFKSALSNSPIEL